MHLEMEACPSLCRIAMLVLLTLGGCESQQPECGVAVKNTRIVGGAAAPPGSWPWQASLNEAGSFRCGGSLITESWVLTAAHCVDDHRLITVFLGRHSQSGSNPKEVLRKVQRSVCHPGYDFLTIDNDICLLQLEAPVNFTDEISPVCLASRNSTFHSGTSSWVIGWGEKDNGQLANILQEVKVGVVGNNECGCSHQDLTGNMMCAGVREGGKDACRGDSGGPLVSKHSSANAWIQSGIVSYGEDCGKPGFYGVYTRVSQYQDWISGVTGSSQPGFVTFTSPGVNGDEGFTCPTPGPPGASTTPTAPNSTTTVVKTTTPEATPPEITPPRTPPPESTPPRTPPLEATPPETTPPHTRCLVTDDDRSVFGGGDHVAHSSFTATVSCLCALVLSLHILA